MRAGRRWGNAGGRCPCPRDHPSPSLSVPSSERGCEMSPVERAALPSSVASPGFIWEPQCIHHKEDFSKAGAREVFLIARVTGTCRFCASSGSGGPGFLHELSQPSRAHWAHLSAARAQERLVYLNSWLRHGYKKGSEVWIYGRPVVPVPAQPKIVTVCLCSSCWDRGTCHWQSNGGFSRPSASVGAYWVLTVFRVFAFHVLFPE